jgi:hypothetical protein
MAANSLSAAWRSSTISWASTSGGSRLSVSSRARSPHPRDVEVDLVAGDQLIVVEAPKALRFHAVGARLVREIRLDILF